MINPIWRPKNWDELKRKVICSGYEEKRTPTFLDGVEIGASALLEALEETQEGDTPIGHDRSSHIDNSGVLLPNAENDLRKGITEAVERIIKLPSGVPLAILCSPVSNGYKVRVRSRLMPDQFVEATLSESSLRNLDSEWRKFRRVVVEAFTQGLLHP